MLALSVLLWGSYLGLILIFVFVLPFGGLFRFNVEFVLLCICCV